MKLDRDLLKKLLDHVGCGDLDNFGMCEDCSKIREILRGLLHDYS